MRDFNIAISIYKVVMKFMTFCSELPFPFQELPNESLLGKGSENATLWGTTLFYFFFLL